MPTHFQSNEEIPNSKILQQIQNLFLCSNQVQIYLQNKKTKQNCQPNQNKPKHKTLPPTMMPKFEKISEFEKLIHSQASQLIKKTFIIELYRGVKYSLKSLKVPKDTSITQKQVQLKEPAQSKQKFLFLDLDQTLIFTERQHSSELKPNQISFRIHIRPYTAEFLLNMSKHYNIYIFTAATKQYAKAVMNKLNKENNIIQDFLCRDHCFETKRGKVIKDLRIVQNRTLKDIILVDNKVQSFGLQIDNGIPILDFYGAKNDSELQHLEKMLLQVSTHEDVRKGISGHFRLKQLVQLSKEELQQYLKKGKSLGITQKIIIESFKS